MGLFAKLSSYDERSARLAGIGLMLLSIFMFSFGDALGKYMVATYSVGQLLWLRACAALLVLLPVIWQQRAEFKRIERPWLQLLRVLLSTAESPPSFSPPSTCRWPDVGSLSFALLMLITRSLRSTPDIVLTTSQFGGTFLLGALMSPIGWVTPTLGSLALFAAAGVTSVVALLCINRSLKLAPASVVVPYQYSMIVWAVIFGFVVWGDVPSISTLIGAAIIIGAGFYIFLREQQLGREETVVNPPA
jgi:drug/metabolite transporter (DMT)-like permease